MLEKLCKCGKEPRREGQRYGHNCHAKYMREYRKKKDRLDSTALMGLLLYLQ